VYIVLSYAAYVLLGVIAVMLIFVLGVAVVVIEEGLRAIRKGLLRIISSEKPVAERCAGFFEELSKAYALRKVVDARRIARVLRLLAFTVFLASSASAALTYARKTDHRIPTHFVQPAPERR
jgi:hypothetical protein